MLAALDAAPSWCDSSATRGSTPPRRVYEWDYSRQLLHLRAAEAAGAPIARGRAVLGALPRPAPAPAGDRPLGARRGAADRRDRPRRRRVRGLPPRAPVRLRGHRSRAGQIRAAVPPIVVLTSNRTRDVHDALKRRCLYHWIDHPDFEREVAILRRKAPAADAGLAGQVAGAGGELPRARSLQATGRRRDHRLGQRARPSRRGATRRGDGRGDPGRRPQVPGGPGPGRRGRPAGAGRGGRCPWCRPRPDPATSVGARAAVGFVRLLRAAGIRVPVGSSALFGEALGVLGWDAASDVYWAGRATLVRRPEDVGTYDACFGAWFGTAIDADEPVVAVPTEAIVALDLPAAADADGRADTDADAPVLAVRFSRAEALRTRDFATYTPAEHEEARRVLADLRVAGARRRSRRLGAHRRAHRRPDVRRTVRAALRTGGEPVVRAWRAPTVKPRRLVVLCDVSGSMEPYTRVILRFLHRAVTARHRVEAFVVGTRLTRITRELSNRDPDAAIAAAARRVVDWSGGTRLGEGLRTFNDRWGIPRPGPGGGRRDRLGRVGPWRPGPARRADGAPRPGRAPNRLGEPAEGVARVRTPGCRDGRGAPVGRRLRRGSLAGVARGARRGARAGWVREGGARRHRAVATGRPAGGDRAGRRRRGVGAARRRGHDGCERRR